MIYLALSIALASIVLAVLCAAQVFRLSIDVAIMKRDSHTVSYIPVDRQGPTAKQLHEQFLKNMEAMIE